MDLSLLYQLLNQGDGAESAPEGTPGRSTITARLAPRPAAPTIVFRVADPATARALGSALSGRDANGVADGADQAVEDAASSPGAPLRADLRERFEASLGADLSNVRVHTSDDSAQAARAVGARAYTVGSDIHFGASQYQPDDPFGLHLLAHEVAHTVQQAGGATAGRQHKLEVSTPADALELEADRAADAMVSGRPAAVTGGGSSVARTIMRDKDGGDGQAQANAGDGKGGDGQPGVWSDADKVKFEEEKKSTLAKIEAELAKMKAIKESAVLAGFKTRLKTDIEIRHNRRDQLKRQLADLERRKASEKELAEVRAILATEEAQLAEVEGNGPTRIAKIAGNAAGSAKKVIDAGKLIAEKTGAMDAAGFKSLSEALGTFKTIASLAEVTARVLQQDTLASFESNPDFDTAAAWGAHVGSTLAAASGLAGGIPVWGPVVAGSLQSAAVVINEFGNLVREHRAKIDAATKGPRGQVLGDGEYSKEADRR